MDCPFDDESLAAYAAGELSAEGAQPVEAHLAECDPCRHRVKALRRVDAALARVVPHRPAAGGLLNVRRALAGQLRTAGPEVLTLEEVAELLRLGPAEMDEVAGELPAFELAGRVRVRRAKLTEWIEQRESRFQSAAEGHRVARSLRLHSERNAS